MEFKFLADPWVPSWVKAGAAHLEKSTEKALPVIISSSGGAILAEGMFSLMQMAKTCGALAYHANHPLYQRADQPDLRGCHGELRKRGRSHHRRTRRGNWVCWRCASSRTPYTGRNCPGFQTAEFLLDHGLIDAIVSRKEMKKQLVDYLDFMGAGPRHRRRADTSRPRRIDSKEVNPADGSVSAMAGRF